MSSKSKKNTKKSTHKTYNRWWEKSKVTNYGTGVQDRSVGPFTVRTWSDDKCLRMIGYDAFEHFGLTHDEADFLSESGDWTCFVDKNDNRLSFSGIDQGDTDEKFVFSTAIDVFTSIVSLKVLTHSMSDDDLMRYCKIIDKMATSRKDIFKWYFTTNPNCPAYSGDYSDLSVINTFRTYANQQIEYCVNLYLEQHGLSIDSPGVSRKLAY